jgi:hypothetical protein
METETALPALPANPLRFHAWCDTCQDHTESDDTTSRWCLECGDRREN